jgi:hypothetical protein
MKMIKKFEDFDLGRFSDTDSDEQEWLDHVSKVEMEDDIEDDEIYDEEETEDCEDCVTDEAPRRKTWGDEVIENRIIKSFDKFSSINEEGLFSSKLELYVIEELEKNIAKYIAQGVDAARSGIKFTYDKTGWGNKTTADMSELKESDFKEAYELVKNNNFKTKVEFPNSNVELAWKYIERSAEYSASRKGGDRTFGSGS